MVKQSKVLKIIGNEITYSKLDRYKKYIEEEERKQADENARKMGFSSAKSFKDVYKEASENVKKSFGKIAVKDSIDDYVPQSERGVQNNKINIGNEFDFTSWDNVHANIYISPYEAMSLYSQQGIFGAIIDKKSKNILLNGLYIHNPLLTRKQLDEIQERCSQLNLIKYISDGIRDALVYGGDLLFPMFIKDSRFTYSKSIGYLIKYGIIHKHCISHFVNLDRWNTVIIPPTNPVSKEYIEPKTYRIPFLQSDVNHTRCARIITSEQAGFLGKMATQGWGTSDFCGYLRSGLSYKIAVQSLPIMIQQMSILVRSLDAEKILMEDGSNGLADAIASTNDQLRGISANNPIITDIGEIKCINRDFGGVVDLLKLLRQEFCADAHVFEPMFYSQQKGNFSSGDDTRGNMDKQWEVLRTIYKQVATQCQNIAKIIILDTLGCDDDIVKKISATKVSFDEPTIASAVEKSEIGENLSKSVFNYAASGMPLDIATEMAFENANLEMKLSDDTIEILKKVQKEKDEKAMERERLENEQIRLGIKQHKSEKDGYSKLEQAQHSFTRGKEKRAEKQQQAKSKGAI